MTPAAGFGMVAFEALLQGGAESASAIHILADRACSAHRNAPADDSSAFVTHLGARPLTDAQRTEFARMRGHIERRAGAGRIRHLHGGAGEDILFDLALGLAELRGNDRAAEANTLANRYLDVTPQGATGWALLPLFVSVRATSIRQDALAEAALRPGAPRLVAIGGLSGTGKSTLARLVSHRLGRIPGARVLRSDVFRKRLAGLAPEARLRPEHYTRRSDQETYEAMFESADDHLACGSSVFLDAVFMSRSERDVAEALAARSRVPFTGFWLEAPEHDRIARVEARVGDASDATQKVVREQSRRSVGEIHWHRIRTNRPLETIVPAARAVLDRAAG